MPQGRQAGVGSQTLWEYFQIMLWQPKLSVCYRLQLFLWRPKLTETYVLANINPGSELLLLLGLFHCELSTHGLLGVGESSLYQG